MQLPKVAEAVKKIPILSDILGYTPKPGLEAGLAGTGVGAVAILGPIAAIKATGFFIKQAIPKILPTLGKAAKSIIPKTLKGKIFAGTAGLVGYGVLKESPLARSFVVEKIKELPKAPGKAIELGGDIGGLIEGKEDGLTIKEGLKKAGIIGAGAAAVAIGIAAIPKVKEFVEKRKAAKELQTQPSIITPIPKTISGEIPTTQLVEKPKDLKTSLPSIKILNKPNIVIQNVIAN